jgi:hypothetical protein
VFNYVQMHYRRVHVLRDITLRNTTRLNPSNPHAKKTIKYNLPQAHALNMLCHNYLTSSGVLCNTAYYWSLQLTWSSEDTSVSYLINQLHGAESFLRLYSDSQEFPSLLWNPKVHYHVHKKLVVVLSWVRCIQSTPSHPVSLRFILMLSYYLHLGLLSGLFFPSSFPISY